MATLRVSPAAPSAAAPATSSRTSGPAARRSVAAPAAPIFATLRLAFYNVGLQTAQLQPTAPRWTEYMSRLCNDVRRIFSDIPDLAILHLCECGGHGASVPPAVRMRLQEGCSFCNILFQDNYVLLWRAELVHFTTAPSLHPLLVRPTAAGRPHTYQMYQCLPAAAPCQLSPITVVHLHNRSSKAHVLKDSVRKRIVEWMADLPPPWITGGDLNIQRWKVEQHARVGSVADSGAAGADLLFHSPDLPVQPLPCRVGRFFNRECISDAHNVVLAEVLLPEGPPPSHRLPEPSAPASFFPPLPAGGAAAPATPSGSIPADTQQPARDTQIGPEGSPPRRRLRDPSEPASFFPSLRAGGAAAPAPPTSALPATTRVPAQNTQMPVSMPPASPGTSGCRDWPAPWLPSPATRAPLPAPPPSPSGSCGAVAPAPRPIPLSQCPPQPPPTPPTPTGSADAPPSADAHGTADAAPPAADPAHSAHFVASPDSSSALAFVTPLAPLTAADARGTATADLPETEGEEIHPLRAELLALATCRAVAPRDVLRLLPPPPSYTSFSLAWAWSVDGQQYTWPDFVEYYGPAKAEERWNFACKVTQEVHQATLSLVSLHERLRDIADTVPAVRDLADTVRLFLIDPALPPLDMPQRLRMLLLLPLWVRRHALESCGCADSERMSESMFTTTWLHWQRAWCEAELTPRQWHQNSVTKRGYFFAYLKRTCGNPVWVKALLKHGTKYLAPLLLTLLEARAANPVSRGGRVLWRRVDAEYDAWLAS